MVNRKSLVMGIGDTSQTEKFYDNWSNDYDLTLKIWNYKLPNKSAMMLKKKIKF